MRISELTDGARNVDLDEVECISFGEPREGTTRYGDPYKVIEATIKDDTGEIKLTLWNEDIEKVRVGTKLKIGNGYTNSFLGEVKLNIGRYGTMETGEELEVRKHKLEKEEMDGEIAILERELKMLREFLRLMYSYDSRQVEIQEWLDTAHEAENYGLDSTGKSIDELNKMIYTIYLHNRAKSLGIDVSGLGNKEIERMIQREEALPPSRRGGGPDYRRTSHDRD